MWEILPFPRSMWYWKEKEIAQGFSFMIRSIINIIIIAINVEIVVFYEKYVFIKCRFLKEICNCMRNLSVLIVANYVIRDKNVYKRNIFLLKFSF